MELKELQDHLQTATAEIKTLVESQDAEIKAQGETSKATAEALAAATARMDEIKAELDGVQTKLARPGYGEAEAAKSLGDFFTASEEFKSYVERGGRGDMRGVHAACVA